MRAEVIITLVFFLTVALSAGVLIFVRRRVARANFNRIIARFEREQASRWPPAPHEPSAAERAAQRNF